MIGRDDVGTVDDLHASATKVVGLDDFGDPGYREGLRVLLESYAKDAELTPSATRSIALSCAARSSRDC